MFFDDQIWITNSTLNRVAGVVVSCKIPILATRVRFPGDATFLADIVFTLLYLPIFSCCNFFSQGWKQNISWEEWHTNTTILFREWTWKNRWWYIKLQFHHATTKIWHHKIKSCKRSFWLWHTCCMYFQWLFHSRNLKIILFHTIMHFLKHYSQ